MDLLGIDKLTNAFGLLLLFQGIGSFIGPPIAGFMFDQTQSYTLSFLFAGSSMVFSGLILYFCIPILQSNSMREKNEKANATNNVMSPEWKSLNWILKQVEKEVLQIFEIQLYLEIKLVVISY